MLKSINYFSYLDKLVLNYLFSYKFFTFDVHWFSLQLKYLTCTYKQCICKVLLTIRLYTYQASLRNVTNWEIVFEKKRKLWQTFALVLLVTLSAIGALVLKANSFF